MTFDYSSVPTPSFLVDEAGLRRNLAVLRQVRDRTGCHILLALKGFAMFHVFPLLRGVLEGTTASGLDEALLGAEEFGGEVHVCGPAYSEKDMAAIVRVADHIVFNSFAQWRRFRPMVEASGRAIECGLRLNPECSSAPVEKYDPCGRFSRFGVTRAEFRPEEMDGLDGLHFHGLCEQNADALERMLAAAEERFGEHFRRVKWVNFGGGHHITRGDYDVDLLCRLINDFRAKYGVKVYLEPGEAIALNAGVLVASVLDIVRNEKQIAVLDASASTHMPDVLEMPYRPEIVGAGHPGEKQHTYRLAGPTCLAGDVIGDYSFDEPLRLGEKLVFLDMAHYSMVKTNTFNGVRLASIGVMDSEEGTWRIVREFGYQDYKTRLS